MRARSVRAGFFCFGLVVSMAWQDRKTSLIAGLQGSSAFLNPPSSVISLLDRAEKSLAGVRPAFFRELYRPEPL